MMKNSAAAKVAAGDDVTRWRAGAGLANVRGRANVSAGYMRVPVCAAGLERLWRRTEIHEREIKTRVKKAFVSVAAAAAGCRPDGFLRPSKPGRSHKMSQGSFRSVRTLSSP